MKAFFFGLIIALLIVSSGLAMILFGFLWLNRGFDAAWAEFERLVLAALD